MENLLDLMFIEREGLPEPNLAIRNNVVLRQLLERDEGRVYDGVLIRQKARKELAYIYYMCKRDLMSGYTKEQKHEKLVQRIGFPDTWQPDELVLKAIEELREDTITKQDRLIDSLEVLADDLLELHTTMHKNNRRLIEFFSRDVSELNGEEQLRRTEEIKMAKEEMLKGKETVQHIEYIVNSLDKMKAQRISLQQTTAKRKLSVLETDKEKYRGTADIEKD
jgi:hypothetical protein